LKNEKTKTYFVKRREHLASGIRDLDDGSWNSASLLSDFTYPWEDESAPDMEFRALHDDQWLYCFFRVRDKNVLTYVKESTKEEVLLGDRVELFLSTDENLTSYYGIEIDPNARVYDYHAAHYRKFNAAWQWPDGQLQIIAKKSVDGYDVSVSMSIQSLKELGLLHNQTLRAGIFRGKCMEINLTEDRMRWISWVRPDSATPDFHIPSAFGTFVLQ
jgi:hypothetical protein